MRYAHKLLHTLRVRSRTRCLICCQHYPSPSKIANFPYFGKSNNMVRRSTSFPVECTRFDVDRTDRDMAENRKKPYYRSPSKTPKTSCNTISGQCQSFSTVRITEKLTKSRISLLSPTDQQGSTFYVISGRMHSGDDDRASNS